MLGLDRNNNNGKSKVIVPRICQVYLGEDWRKLVVKSTVVPQRSARLRDR